MMINNLILLLLVTLLSSPPPISSSSPLVQTPISKDPLTSLYTLTLDNRRYLLDLGGPLLWSHCSGHHPTIPCKSTTCALANSLYSPPQCPHPPNPNPNPNLPSCTCTILLANPISHSCTSSSLTSIPLSISPKTPLISACAPKSLLNSLPLTCSGLAGLSRSPLSLSNQLSFSLALKPQFSLCLPSVALFGELRRPSLPPIAYTSLLRNPIQQYSDSYYIRVTGIAVDSLSVQFLSRVLQFDSLGHGGVRLSTIVPYTKMMNHIYRPFLLAFSRATVDVPRAPSVAPFDLCFNTKGLVVDDSFPRVDFMLSGGKNWTIGARNSLKEVGDDVACLGFVNGGLRMDSAVVVGGAQMEERVLVFDLERSKLGFSDSLLTSSTATGTTSACANYFH